MAEHVTYVPISPLRPTTSVPGMTATRHETRQMGHTSRTTPFSSKHELSNRRDWLHRILSRMTRHPHFESLFPYIKLCLQLEENAWNAYSRLREDLDAKSKLEFWHPSIWHSPPEDVWMSIVQLRKGSMFSNLQPFILLEIQDAYVRSCRAKVNTQRHSSASDMVLWEEDKSIAVEQPTIHDPTSSVSQPRSDQGAESMQSNLRRGVNLSVSPSRPATSTANLSSQRPLAKLAPDGMVYHCPSRYCTRDFKKQAFYIKHLEQKHPDFGPRHAHHSPEMSLQPPASSNPPNERPRHSHSSTVSLPVFDDHSDPMDDSRTPEIIAHGLVLDDNDDDMLYMGGGISMDGVNVEMNVGMGMSLKPCNNYFASYQENQSVQWNHGQLVD